MRNVILFFFFIACTSLSAQLPTSLTNCGIKFDHDSGGNRIKRYICLENRPMRYTDATEDQATQFLDLQATADEEGLEKEILQLEALLSQPGALDLQSSDQANKEAIALTDQNFSDLSNMLVFPNPTMSSFSISGEGLNPESTLSVISMDGQILSQRVLGDGRDIDVSSLPVGAYVITLVHKEERRLSMLIKSDQP